jgi:hypothetical protein
VKSMVIGDEVGLLGKEKILFIIAQMIGMLLVFNGVEISIGYIVNIGMILFLKHQIYLLPLGIILI